MMAAYGCNADQESDAYLGLCLKMSMDVMHPYCVVKSLIQRTTVTNTMIQYRRDM